MQTELIATLTCPSCGAEALERIRSDTCIVEYACPSCGVPLRPMPGDGCVFCSYSNLTCDQATCSRARCLPESGERFHVVLGVSPFNSYYTEQRLTALLVWSAAHFERVDVFVPDTPTIWTLEAGGYSSQEAARKTERQIRYLRNKIERAMARIHHPSAALLPWSVMSGMREYRSLHERCVRAFDADADFRRACLEATEEVLENRRRDAHTLDTADRTRAVGYLMAELPVILFGCVLMAAPTSTFVYHRALPLFEQLFAGEFTIRPAPGQHFMIATELDAMV